MISKARFSQAFKLEEKMGVKQPAGFPLRMSADLRTALQSEAEKNGRSLNQEIVERLGKSVGPPPKVPKGLQEIITAAMPDSKESIEEAAVRLIVAGIRSEEFRSTTEARMAAERYRNVAVYELLSSTHAALADLVQHVGKIPGVSDERIEEASRRSEVLKRQIRQLDLFRSLGR